MDIKEFSNLMINYGKEINIVFTEEQLQKFYKYMNLLIEWNEKINLTAIVEPKEIILKHFIDSLTIIKYIELNKSVIDIGTGAGFPGIPIKIMREDLDITLLDSLNKRIHFLNEVIQKLELKNITAVHARIEEYGTKNREKYDVVTARAVSKLNILLEYAIPLAKPQKYFISLKGHIEEEIINAKNAMDKLDVEITKKEEFLLPIENSSRTIIMFKKRNKTNLKYPRRYSEMLKKPL